MKIDKKYKSVVYSVIAAGLGAAIPLAMVGGLWLVEVIFEIMGV